MDDELTLEDAEQVLAAQPFSRLLGARILAFGPGHASLGLAVEDQTPSSSGTSTGV